MHQHKLLKVGQDLSRKISTLVLNKQLLQKQYIIHKYKDKLVILQSIETIRSYKSKETKVVTYACRYSSGP